MALTKAFPRMMEGVPISVKDFGAVGDGVTDDTAAVQNALNAAVFVFIPDGTFIVDGLQTTQKNKIFGSGTLKMKADGSGDFVISLENDHCMVSGITIDGNSPNHSTYSGRGDGIKINADYCVIDSVTTQDIFVGALSHGFFINEDKDSTIIQNCVHKNGAYAAIRSRGENTLIRNFVGLQWNDKGFACDFGCEKLTIDGAYFESTVTNSGMNNVLIDTGGGARGVVENAVLKNITANGPENATDGNSTKLMHVTNAFYENCRFRHTNSGIDSLNTLESQTNLTIRDCLFDGILDPEATLGEIFIENSDINTGQAGDSGRAIEDLKGSRIVIKNCRISAFTNQALRIEGTAGSQQVLIDGNTFVAPSGNTTAKIFSFDYTPDPGDVVYVNNTLTNGDPTPDPFGGTSAVRRNISRVSDGGLRKFFEDSVIPATSTWQTGDIVWNLSPSAGGTVGWVCVSGGTPGTWKAFGTIAS